MGVWIIKSKTNILAKVILLLKMSTNAPEIVEKQLSELQKSLYRYRNGETVSLMEKEGIRYGKNYGLRFAEILEVARAFDRNHEFAGVLRTLDVREYQLIAMLLDDWSVYRPEEVVALCSAFRYQEEAEFAARYALAQDAGGWEICQLLMVAAEKYARMTGNLLLARLSMAVAGGPPDGAKYISLLRRQLAGLDSFDRSIAVCASALAKVSEANRQLIEELVKELKNSNERQLLLVAYEIEIRL
jgi:hypothetical protein